MKWKLYFYVSLVESIQEDACKSLLLTIDANRTERAQCHYSESLSFNSCDGGFICSDEQNWEEALFGHSKLDDGFTFSHLKDILESPFETVDQFSKPHRLKNGTYVWQPRRDGWFMLNKSTSEYRAVFSPVAVPFLTKVYDRPNLPRRIYVLVLDSTSRMGAEAYAPNISRFIQAHQFVSFNNFTPVSPGGTRATFFPLFYGGISQACDAAALAKTKLAGLIDFSDIARSCSPHNRQILKIAKKYGFQTTLAEMTGSRMYFLKEDFDHFLPAVPLGKMKNSSHLGLSDSTCIGGQFGYQHVIDFAERSLFTNPENQPKLVITHLSASHESPAALQSIDDVVARHLAKIIQQDPDVFIIVMGDHGRADLNCDYRRPLLSLKTSNQYWDDNLKRNSHLRVSPWDLYLTLRSAISGSADFSPSDFGSDSIIAMPLSLFDQRITFTMKSTFKPISLVAEQYRDTEGRTCEEAGIAPVVCTQDHAGGQVAWICAEAPAGSKLSFLSNFDVKNKFEFGSPGLFTFCQQYSIVAQESVNFLNSISNRLAPVCPHLFLHSLEAVVDDSSIGVYYIFFHVSLAENGAHVASFMFQLSNMDTLGVLSMKLLMFKQLTRYRPNEFCTPRDLSPEVCLCGLKL